MNFQFFLILNNSIILCDSKQERLDFLYDSGLAVGKGSSSDGGGFKALEAKTADTGKAGEAAAAASSSAPASATPGALFEDKPQSANDAWRKLHSDPLLMIRQREQEALARIKNNPVQMAMIRKSVCSSSSSNFFIYFLINVNYGCNCISCFEFKAMGSCDCKTEFWVLKTLF